MRDIYYQLKSGRSSDKFIFYNKGRLSIDRKTFIIPSHLDKKDIIDWCKFHNINATVIPTIATSIKIEINAYISTSNC